MEVKIKIKKRIKIKPKVVIKKILTSNSTNANQSDIDELEEKISETPPA